MAGLARAAQDKSHGLVATDDLATAGAVTWWRLKGEVNRLALTNKGLAAGFRAEDLPASVTEEQALRRAVEAVRDPGCMLRPLPNGALALVAERPKGLDDLEYTVEVSFRLEEGEVRAKGRLATAKIQGDVQDAFLHHRNNYSTTDISGWLVERTEACKAVGLRDGGGIYWVPRATLDEWRKIAGVLEAVSAHKLSRIPAMRSEEAIAAILEAITIEADARVAEIEADIAAGNLGTRAINTRLARAAEIEGLLGAYKDFLGDQLVAVQARAERLHAGLAVLEK